MTSKDLAKYGFMTWHEFSMQNKTGLLQILPRQKGVYVIRYKKSFGRFKGKSDIVYFGSSINKIGGLRKRIWSYFSPGKTFGMRRKKKWIKEVGKLEFSFLVMTDNEKIRGLERALRMRYQQDHLEFPPLNRNE